jgi:hypothetical protein
MSDDITCLFCGEEHDTRIICYAHEIIKKSPYVKLLDQKRIDLLEELEELHQNTCDECSAEDYGWNYNRVEGRVPCVCITESGAYQELESKISELERSKNK